MAVTHHRYTPRRHRAPAGCHYQLAARELPDWFVHELLRWTAWMGFVTSTTIGLVSMFGHPDVMIPTVIMLMSSLVFVAAIRAHDDGMMLIRALGIFAVAAFARAVTLIVFFDGLPWNNAIVAFLLWSMLAASAMLLIRMLIVWGVVVRPPKHRW